MMNDDQQTIEFWENEYLKQIEHCLRIDYDKMMYGFATKEYIKDDWKPFLGKETSDFARGAERIFYWLFNQFGQPNSSPIGSDLFFETYNAYVHIDIKTVTLANIGDYTRNIFVGNNQVSYCALIEKQNGNNEMYIPNLPTIYTKKEENNNIPVLEDSAEALGSSYKGQKCGTFGDIGVLSFNGNKIITSGGGGVIVTDDEAIAKRAKHITTTAKIPHPYEYVHDEIGYNYRLPNINAALLVAQLEQLEKFLASKRNLAIKYKEFFTTNNINFIIEPKDSKSNYWLQAVLLNDENQRNEFLEFTNKKGVMTRPIWKLMNELEMFKDCQKTDLKNAKYLEERVVNIPSSVRLPI